MSRVANAFYTISRLSQALCDSLEHLAPLGFWDNIDYYCARDSIRTQPMNNNFRKKRSDHRFERNMHLGTSTNVHERPQPSSMVLNHHKPPQDALRALWMFVDIAAVDGSCVEEMT